MKKRKQLGIISRGKGGTRENRPSSLVDTM
jgi:hypothetical protein